MIIYLFEGTIWNGNQCIDPDNCPCYDINGKYFDQGVSITDKRNCEIW